MGIARFAVLAAVALLLCGLPPIQPRAAHAQDAAAPSPSYSRDVRPIFERTCVACHACYDAPCQLILSSPDGLRRGASQQPVFNATRLREMAPTRLFTDAQSVAEWRDKGFFSVLESPTPDGDRTESLLGRVIELGRSRPLAPNAPVPDDIALGFGRKNLCPAPDDIDGFARDHPRHGMPFAMTGLSDGEYRVLRQWLRKGAAIDAEPSAPAPAEQAQIRLWEDFFNRPAPRNRLVSRYLYEHLFLAHLYFSELETGNFFELVRSGTAPGSPIRPIATVRPNDDPGAPFHYRLRKVESSIVHKTHMAYPLSAARMARFQALFLAPDWDVAELPGYTRRNAINPFTTFAAIPAGARYRFLLDSAEFFVRNFIRGPVCAGQVATNVINDHFFVVFLDPESDLSVTDPAYMAEIAPKLILVPEREGLLIPLEDRLRQAGLLDLPFDWDHRKEERNDYILLRGRHYRARQPQGPSLQDIWDGEGVNDNAALTVFRNFDNAMVTKALVGAVPKTLWVMDYPLFERSFYLLVTNFNVFGALPSQVETRFYFDLIRAGGEDNFLHFMPPAARGAMRGSWYRGTAAQNKIRDTYEIVNEDLPVQIAYESADPKAEFVARLAARLGAQAGPPDPLNRCAEAPCTRADASPAERRVETALQGLTARPAAAAGMGFLRFMPDLAFLRVVTGGGTDLAYTLVRNKAHSNVAFMFKEEERRLPTEDRLTVHRGLLGSYPNFFFAVPLAEIEAFAQALRAADTPAAFRAVIRRHGIPRSHPDLWRHARWFRADMGRRNPMEAGIYDLNRYERVSDLLAGNEP